MNEIDYQILSLGGPRNFTIFSMEKLILFLNKKYFACCMYDSLKNLRRYLHNANCFSITNDPKQIYDRSMAEKAKLLGLKNSGIIGIKKLQGQTNWPCHEMEKGPGNGRAAFEAEVPGWVTSGVAKDFRAPLNSSLRNLVKPSMRLNDYNRQISIELDLPQRLQSGLRLRLSLHQIAGDRLELVNDSLLDCVSSGENCISSDLLEREILPPPAASEYISETSIADEEWSIKIGFASVVTVILDYLTAKSAWIVSEFDKTRFVEDLSIVEFEKEKRNLFIACRDIVGNESPFQKSLSETLVTQAFEIGIENVSEILGISKELYIERIARIAEILFQKNKSRIFEKNIVFGEHDQKIAANIDILIDIFCMQHESSKAISVEDGCQLMKSFCSRQWIFRNDVEKSLREFGLTSSEAIEAMQVAIDLSTNKNELVENMAIFPLQRFILSEFTNYQNEGTWAGTQVVW